MEKEKNKAIALVGPTAVGKTEYALAIAKELDGEIVSCDSMQLYKYMDIGSAKPTKEELASVPHHMIDFLNPKEKYSVARYKRDAEIAILDIFSRGKIPIISGGTGLYLNALLYNMDFASPPMDEEFRNYLYKVAEEEGPLALHKKLLVLDEKRAKEIHPNNIKRVVRAIETAKSRTNIPQNNFREIVKNPNYDILLIGLTRNRETLYQRMNQRVDLLMDMGLEAEVKGLIDRGFTEKDIAMKGIGYKELFGYFKGEYTLEDAITLIKRNTRHYGKRQITWFKRYTDMEWFALDNKEKRQIVEEMLLWIRKNK